MRAGAMPCPGRATRGRSGASAPHDSWRSSVAGARSPRILPAAGVATLKGEAADGPLADGVKDADYFLAVARSLLSGSQENTALGQEKRVAKTLDACEKQALEKFELFGRARDVDFSQFTPRGHYNDSPQLQQYFRATMWLGRTDFRFIQTMENGDQVFHRRQFDAASPTDNCDAPST